MSNSNIQNGPSFLLPAYSTQNRSPEIRNFNDNNNVDTDSALLWDEKYTPLTVDELAVRDNKLMELRQFLASSAISSRTGQYKLLLLTGPTGCGKSTSIRVLAKSLDYDIIEWSNHPQISHTGSYDPDYEPTMVKFSHFLKRSIESTSLNMNDSQQRKPKIILLDDLPDLTTPSIKYEFQSILKSYIDSDYKFLLTIVISEAQMSSNSNRSRGYFQNETQLINTPDILTHDMKISGKCGVIEFNPVTKANLKKAMKRILVQESRYSNVSLSVDQMNNIADQCHGDIRCAIMTMQFYCTSRTFLPQKRKRSPLMDTSSQSSSQSSNIHCRENPLTFYHVIGKVLYAKRDESGTLESKPTDILNKCNVECDPFIGWIYSNYHHFADNVSDYSKAMNYICDADMLGSMGYWKENLFSQYQMLISMHGVMSTKRTGNSRGMLEFTRPDERYFRYNRTKLLETASKIKPIVNIQEDKNPTTNSVDNKQVDEIEMFSEDEFDDIYGDDLDSSIFDSLP